MERHLDSKFVVITGGAEGIGFAIADKFIEQGAKVMLLDLNEHTATVAVKTLNLKYGSGKADFIKCDVTTDLETVYQTILNENNRVDVLVNSAGIVSEGDARKTLEVNAIAVIEWSMKFREHMRKDKGGHGGSIINISSVYGLIIDEYLAVYKASKFAVNAFTRSMGHGNNYKRSNVRLIAICPGFTHSTLTSKLTCMAEHRDEFAEYLKKVPWQSTDAVGRAAVEIFKVADSATVWKIEGDKSIEQVA